MIPLREVRAAHSDAWVWPGAGPAVSLRLDWPGGAARDPEGKDGAAALTASLLDEGAGPLDSEGYTDALRDRGIGVSFSVDRDRFTVSMRALREAWPEAVRLIALALSVPRFEAAAIERMRAALIQSARRELETPRGRAGIAFWPAMLPGHPAARRPQGTEATLAGFTPEDIRAGLGRLMAGRPVAVVAGDLPEAEVAATLDLLVPQSVPDLPIPGLPPPPAAFATLVAMEAPQAQIVFGQRVFPPSDPDWEAGSVMMRVLAGGGFGPRLSEVVRERGGLTYGISAGAMPLADGALIVGSAATRTDGVRQTIAMVREEWARMAAEGPTEREVADAVGYLNGTLARQFAETGRAASALLAARRTGRSTGWIQGRAERLRALTRDDVARAARRALDPAGLSFLIAGRQDAL